MKHPQRYYGLLLGLLLLFAIGFGRPLARSAILMIPDGCGFATATLARWYLGRALRLDALLGGAVRTHAANSIISCSAAAATACATGHKTDNGMLAMTPGPDSRSLLTLLEAARTSGKAVGLVVTCALSHATPAAFAAHVPHRDMTDEIMRQLVQQDLDVAFGGGYSQLLPRSRGGRRKDSLDLLAMLQARGYQLVRTAQELTSVNTTPVWGLFADEHLRPAIDRWRHAPTEPSLVAMTAKAIELLSRDPDGFFLLVEGSQIDWGAHANDPIYVVSEFLAFDSAVGVAVDFAIRDSHTLVVACPDHNCGGLSLGSSTSPVKYDATTEDDLLAPLRRMKLTSAGIIRELGSNPSPAALREKVWQWWGVVLTDSELAEIGRLVERGMDLDYALAETYSRYYTPLGWTSHGHTGEDVPLWSFGPGRPTGLMDNTAIARSIASALGLALL